MPGIADSKTVLVVGATAGIGRALALAIHELDSKPTVIVAGRRQNRLDELEQQHERITGLQLNVNADQEELEKFVREIIHKYPDLDTLVYSTGVQRMFDFTRPEGIDTRVVEMEYNTNYLALFKLVTLFLPHFLQLSVQGKPSFIVPITSDLAITPFASVPNYSATKAAVHSLCLSLATQLAHTNVRVMEILPPLVESELHDYLGPSGLSKVWMPLSEFTRIALEGLIRGDVQIPVGNAVDVLNQYEKGKLEATKAFTKIITDAAVSA